MGMILRIASSRIVGQGDIVGRSGYFSLNLSANSVMRGRLDARRTLKSLVADLRLFRFYDENSLFRSRTSWMLEQIVLGVERLFCQFEYRVRSVEPLFLFPVDVWRDLGEWLLCVEKVCICESVKNVLAKLYALPEMEFLLHCNFPKNTLRWKYREIIFVDK